MADEQLNEELWQLLNQLKGQVELIRTQLKPTAEGFQRLRAELLEVRYGPDLFVALRQALKLAEEIPFLIDSLVDGTSITVPEPVPVLK